MSDAHTLSERDVAAALQRGLGAQLETWRRQVQTPGQRLGWKIGFNDKASQQRLGLAHPVIGFLRNDRRLPSGVAFRVPAGATIKAEAEVAMRIGRDLPAGASVEAAEAAIAALAPAIEIVDVTHPLDGLEALLRGNLYQAAVAIGVERPGSLSNPRQAVRAELRTRGGAVRASEPQRLPEHFGELVRVVADLLGAHGETLRAGDWIIGGAIIEPLVVTAGTGIDIDMPPLGRIALDFIAA
jgi:2-keto-4-pentenoate hydratase